MKALKHTIAICSILIASAIPANADAINFSGNATVFWDSLQVTTAPGLTLSWLGTSNQTQVLHFFNNNTVTNMSISNWNDLSYSHQSGGSTATADATNHSLVSSVIWSSAPPSGADWINIGREGNFRAIGSGRATFSIAYSFDAQRSIDAASLSFPYISTGGVVEAGLQLYIPFVIGFANAQESMFVSSAVGSAITSQSETGTLSLDYDLVDGSTYWLRARTSTNLRVMVPETSSLVLLATGLVLVMMRASGERRP